MDENQASEERYQKVAARITLHCISKLLVPQELGAAEDFAKTKIEFNSGENFAIPSQNLEIEPTGE